MTGNFRLRGTSGVRAAGVVAAALSLLAGVAWIAVSPPRAPAAAAAGGRVPIQMKNFAFDPAATTVRVGQTLSWTNDDVVPHTATADQKAWDSGQMAPGRSFTVTVTKPGTYGYTCANHPFMHAKVIVTK